MPILQGPDHYLYKYIPKGYSVFETTIEEDEADGMVKRYCEGEEYPSEHYYWTYPERDYEDKNLCPVCLSAKCEPTPKGRSCKKTCSNPVCKDVYPQFRWKIELKNYAPIPADYIVGGVYVQDENGIVRSESAYPRFYTWKHWKHRDEIDKKRAEVMAIMYLEGRVKLTEEAIPYLDKNYCKPIKYKPINRFSYENFKSNTDALRNYGWSDLLLSGVTPTRSKSQKHAKHH